MSYRFQPEAEAEYLDAVAFYESRRPGLGAALITEFEHVVALIVDRPQAWRKIHEIGIRKLGLGRFSYTGFYLPGEQAIEVTAFLHDRQRPLYWFSRLQN